MHSTEKPAGPGDGPILHIVLYQPQIPPNTGNVGRTCLALGARLWLVRPLGFQLDEKVLRRAGLDYWREVDCHIASDWEDLTGRLPGLDRAWYFSKRSTTCFWDAKFQKGDVLVFGCETQGLPDWMLAAHADRKLGIPIRDPVRSLNLASAVAVAAYEARRQITL